MRGGASGGYNFASNANQTNIAIIAGSIDSQNANILVLVPAGREEDTVSFLFGSTDTRYAGLSWLWMPDVTLSAGVKFTQQISSHSDLDWNGFNLVPRVLFNMKFY